MTLGDNLERINYLIRCLFAILVLVALFFPKVAYSKSGVSQKSLHPAIKARPLPVKPTNTNISDKSKLGYVVVKFKDDSQVRFDGSSFYSKTRVSIGAANARLSTYAPGQIKRLFNEIAEHELDVQKEALSAKVKTELADLNAYYRIDVQSVSDAEMLIGDLNEIDEVEIAYYQPAPELAGFFSESFVPNYQGFQDYREAAPTGVDADFANGLTGGDGAGVKIIDIEGAWRSTHIDLTAAIGSHIAGTEIADLSWRNHGTAVLGEMIANDDGHGVTGICHGASIGTVSIGDLATETALMIAADSLRAGDAILIELHAPGPHYNFQSRPDQLGYVCMEYWQANFDAIQYCWAKGITVVEAAGNGAENFDNATYYGDLFDTTYRNSHAIIAGAGHPAVDFNNLQRESFSNYGERLNLQGYGSSVYSTGYGNLYNGSGVEDSFYTSSFNGTSSASPIITGTVACLQGRYKALFSTILNSDQVRNILVSTGTPQQGNTSQHIGPRPNLAAAIGTLAPSSSLTADPYYLDTSLAEGTTALIAVWLHNGTANDYDFSINDNDSLTKRVTENWLQASPLTGTVPSMDSTRIDVTLDATVISDRLAVYRGVLEISWGNSGGPLDSLTLVPVFLEIPCFDTTYTSKSSKNPDGPTYSWISAKALGFKVPNASYHNSTGNPLDDGTTGPWGIGFSFPFYDSSYSQMYIGVNGALSFTDTALNFGGYYGYLSFPNAEFQSIVSAFWNDLIFDTGPVPSSGLYLYYSPHNDSTVIEWYKPANFNLANDTLTDFEIILTRDGIIKCQYLEVGNGGLNSSAAIGISAVQCAARKHFQNGAPSGNKVTDLEAVRFKSNIWDYILEGDINSDSLTNILDLTFFVDYIFRGGPAPVPFMLGDANCNGTAMQITDLTYLVDYIFRGGLPTCHIILRH